MRKQVVYFLVLMLSGIVTSVVYAQPKQDIQSCPACKLCGMDREQFGHSRFFIEYEDGSNYGACSIHCAALDIAVNLDKVPKSLKVGDYGTKELIDAETAVWVIGGSKPGVMTKRAKWAFGNKEGADVFIKDNGGQVATLDEAMKATYEDMYADTKMIQEKRKMKRGQAHQHNQ